MPDVWVDGIMIEDEFHFAVTSLGYGRYQTFISDDVREAANAAVAYEAKMRKVKLN